MASTAPRPATANPLFDLLDSGDAGDDLRHQIVEISDAWNGQRLDKMLRDMQEMGPAAAATLARRAGEETTLALANVRDHVTSRYE